MSLLNHNFTVNLKRKAARENDKLKSNTVCLEKDTTGPPLKKDVKYEKEKRTRSFLQSWVEEFPWVKYDEKANVMYCKYCRKFPHLSDKDDALTRGTKNLRKDPLKIHVKRSEHNLCAKHWFKELNDPKPTSTAGPSQPLLDTPIAKSLLRLDENQRKRIESLFNTAYGVMKAGKPFSDYELICEIQVKNKLDLGENYLNINGCKTFAASIAQTLVEKQIQDMKNINFLSILSDGSTDISVTEQEIVYVRYVEGSTPVTKMISIESLFKADAQGIFNALQSALEKIDLDFEKLKPNNGNFPNLVCANFDGASVNLGQKGGVIAKIRAKIPDIMGLHCVAHKLELAAYDATKTYKYLEQMESTIKGIFAFYHYSPRRKNEVKAIADVLDADFAHMSDIKSVRWMSSKSRAVSALEQNLKAVTGHLEHNAVSGTRADDANKGKGYLKDLKSIKFLKHLYFLLDYLPILTEISKCFQLEDLLLIEIPDLVESAVLKLNSLKLKPGKFMKKFAELYQMDDKKFGDIVLTGACPHIDFSNDKDIHDFLDLAIKYVKKRFAHLSEAPLSYFQVFNFQKWPLCRQDLGDFGVDDLTSLLDHSSVSPNFTDNEKETILQEWTGLKLQIASLRTNPLMDVYQLIMDMKRKQATQGQQDATCWLKLIEFMMTISPSTSACERGFSRMNFMKSKYRSTLSQTSFNNQLLIMQEGPELEDFNPTDAVKHWMTTGGTKHVNGHKLSGPRKQVEQPVRMEFHLLKE